MPNTIHRSLTVVSLVVLGLTGCEARRDGPERRPGSAAPPPRDPLPDPPPPRRPPDPNVLEASLEIRDLEHVELLDVVRQATALARRLEPEAELSEVRASPVLGGFLNVRASEGHLATIAFQVTHRDSTQPPGRDITEARVAVSLLGGGTLRARRDGFFNPLFKMLGPLPFPACSARKAWELGVASGVPSEAVASVSIWRTPVTRAPEWSFRVAGHDELSRSVDTSTCALKGSAVATKPSPKGSAEPRPAGTRPCGCPAGDLMCHMKCASRK